MSPLSFKLETFEGPLDLLLSLIAKNKVNIYDIPIFLIFEQYIDYIHQMELFNMEIASSFIVMASHLMLIKSRLLLPVKEDEEDPRKELVDMLLEYQKAKAAAEVLHSLELTHKGRYEKPPEEIEISPEYTLTHDLELLREAFCRIYAKAADIDNSLYEIEQNLERHITATRQVSVNERIIHVIKRLRKSKVTSFENLFDDSKTKNEIVATFLALLELVKGKRVLVKYKGENFSDCDIVLVDNIAREYT